MKYKKLLKKAAVSLLLAQSLIFTGLPIQAADIAGQGMVWTESAEMENAGDTVSAVSSDKMAAEESYVQDDFSAGDDLSGSESTLDDAGRGWQWKYGKRCQLHRHDRWKSLPIGRPVRRFLRWWY